MTLSENLSAGIENALSDSTLLVGGSTPRENQTQSLAVGPEEPWAAFVSAVVLSSCLMESVI